ncbi:PEGA domain-containing protein [Myxococcus sp. RHSTA-1-4]|uniref:PEGA domain-containing protein n=1 Tax=Myxococcus sp. RHSTA-1-4 TaxID=2874601 RepID=UPI00351CFD87
MRALHVALCGWLVGILAVGPAAAQPTLPAKLMPRALSTAADESTVTVVAIALDAAARTEALRLAYLAEQEAARSGRLRLVRLADALDANGRREREARAAEAAAAMKEGQRAYDELDTQQALQQFDKAVRASEAGDLSLRFGDLSRARVMKAASQVANGENTAAQLEIRSVLAVDPRAQFSPNFFPPDEMAFVEKERAAVLAAASTALTVRTEPVPAQVYVDGVFRGVSPVALTDLTPADHYVTVLAPGYALAQRRAREGDTTLTLQPLASQKPLQVLTETVARKPQSEERDRALRELGALAGVSQVLALLVRGGAGAGPLDVTALRLDVADGHNLAYTLGPVPRGDAMDAGSRELLARLVSADAPRQGGKPVTHFSTGSATRRTVGYVMMATGVAMLAGGIYFGMEASAKEDDFRRAEQNSARAQDIKDTGKTYALVADIGVLVGLATAGLGGYFAFSGGDGGGKAPARASSAEPPPPTKHEALPMPPPPKAAKAQGEALPMPPPPARSTSSTPPSRGEPSPPARASDSKRTKQEEARQREEALRKQREEEERQRREQEEQRKREEEARKREEEAKRKREEEERRREEEEKKKRPALDEDDLRNY